MHLAQIDTLRAQTKNLMDPKERVQAAKDAGYGSMKMAGFRLMQRPDVIAALQELGNGKLLSLAPKAIHALQMLVDDPNHKDHGKAVFAVLDRTGFHSKTEHKVTSVLRLNDTQVLSAIHSLAGELGMDPRKLLGSRAAAPSREAEDAEVIDYEAELR